MVCRQCKGQVPSDHQGSGCPICGKETVFDLAVQPAPYAAIVMFGSNNQVLSVAVRLRAVDAIARRPRSMSACSRRSMSTSCISSLGPPGLLPLAWPHVEVGNFRARLAGPVCVYACDAPGVALDAFSWRWPLRRDRGWSGSQISAQVTPRTSPFIVQLATGGR